MKYFDPLKFIADNQGMNLVEALVRAYEQGKRDAQEEWIPISKKPPEAGVPVLVTDDAGGMATVDVDTCYEYVDISGRFWCTSQNVTAWMSLPEPYRGEQE